MAVDCRNLMLRYVTGDATAFRDLYAEVAPRVLGYLTGMARDKILAEDLLQQTFMKVHRARSTYIEGADPVPWIFSMAHHTFIDEMRRKQRARVMTTSTGELPEMVADHDGNSAESRDDDRADLGDLPQVMAALSELPTAQREAVVLTKLSGHSMVSAAKIAGTSVGSMKVRAHRGFQLLKRLLANTGDAS